MPKTELAAQLKTLAALIKNSVNDRYAIAAGFELIADVMEPCIDCGATSAEEKSAVIAVEDNPETGA